MNRDNIRPALVCMIIGLGIIVALITSSCKNTNIPPIDVKFWAGDHKLGGIHREQDHETIDCQSEEFDQYVAITYEDIKKVFNTLLMCKDWGSPAMTAREVQEFIQMNPEVVRYVIKAHRKTMEPIRN